MNLTFNDYLAGLRGKRVAALGFGISNRPLVSLLLGAGAEVTVRDKAPRESLGGAAAEYEARGARFVCGADYLAGLDDDVIFRSPGIMPHTPELAAAVARGAALTGETEAFFETAPCRIIAVTGSDGKTTTATLIAEMLKRAGKTVWLGGNLGTPLLQYVPEMTADDVAVVELSSFQLMTMTKSPAVAVVTNCAPNHLDLHRDLEEYYAAKTNIFRFQTAGDRAVLNLDNAVTRGFADGAPGAVTFFSRRAEPAGGVFVRGGVIYDGDEAVLDTAEIRVPGAFNVENFCAAIAAVRGLADKSAVLMAARSFTGVAHRIELVRELRGVKYYNHSIASSPARTAVGLETFPDRVILIAGGKDKGIPYGDLGAPVVKHVKKLVLTGMTADKIRAAVESCPDYRGEPEIFTVPEFEKAVAAAHALARPGDTVLLSPASTSFDRFKNFEERGDYFRKLVEELE
ncbi:MAG: UDP-N-acetylmuramoyl-L-alanine--D-glutamate ligase [Oscillospiraceae bacterium]|nr:UDP-N-acetylmuramoyl-L-alanine--D-glutamate ligase [Oscillospiraceae bacterium]